MSMDKRNTIFQGNIPFKIDQFPNFREGFTDILFCDGIISANFGIFNCTDPGNLCIRNSLILTKLGYCVHNLFIFFNINEIIFFYTFKLHFILTL
jgi:hypothetical protein